MGGSDKNGNKEAQRVRQEEADRQARIRSGTQRVNSIFNGGTYGTGGVQTGDAYDPTKTYYQADGSVWTPPAQSRNGLAGAFGTLGMSNLNPGDNSFESLVRQGKLFTGTATGDGFGENFFNGRRDAFLNYATPQLEQQYGDANKQLTFALTRSNLLNSSARGEKTGKLQRLYDLNSQDIGDQALSHSTQARNAVEDARSNLIATLNATGDSEGAANSALNRASALSQPAAYDPLGQLFANFTSGLGIQAAQEQSFAAGGPRPRYDTGMFGGRSRVTVR